jgi:hypothetical protein
MLCVVVALVGLVVLGFDRLTVTSTGTRSDRTRLEALWLARSALATGQKGHGRVTTGLGVAEVDVQLEHGGLTRRAIVKLPHGTATVTASTGAAPEWTERFEAR